jgi:sugar-specific transcriptional regulator TrmB
MPAEGHTHRADELCEPGRQLYARALRDGAVSSRDTEAAACLLDLGLLSPAVTDPDRLEPVAPALALSRLLRAAEDRIAGERHRSERLAEALEPLMKSAGGYTEPEAPAVRMLSGKNRISDAVTAAMAAADSELLTIQPHSTHVGKPPEVHTLPLHRDQAFLDRGGRIRTLYQHTLRHAPTVTARYEQIQGDVQARTLDEVPERLIVVDRTVAFVPANADRTLALEIRIPALVDYLATTFDRLWRLAVPIYPQTVQPPTLNGITPRQRAIAALLVEGHTDAVIAERLGMNVRTARVHIAKLAATLGSESRAQLGYLIGESGILKQEGARR